MKVLEERDKFLSNYEVYKYIGEVRERNKSDMQYNRSEHLETILLEVQSYLRDRPTGNPEMTQSNQKIEEFIRAVYKEGIELEKAEILQLVNSAPTSEPVLYNLIEDIEQRLDHGQIGQLIGLSQKYLGFEPMPDLNEGE